MILTENQIKAIGKAILGVLSGVMALHWIDSLWIRGDYPTDWSAYVGILVALLMCIVCMQRIEKG